MDFCLSYVIFIRHGLMVALQWKPTFFSVYVDIFLPIYNPGGIPRHREKGSGIAIPIYRHHRKVDGHVQIISRPHFMPLHFQIVSGATCLLLELIVESDCNNGTCVAKKSAQTKPHVKLKKNHKSKILPSIKFQKEDSIAARLWNLRGVIQLGPWKWQNSIDHTTV